MFFLAEKKGPHPHDQVFHVIAYLRKVSPVSVIPTHIRATGAVISPTQNVRGRCAGLGREGAGRSIRPRRGIIAAVLSYRESKASWA